MLTPFAIYLTLLLNAAATVCCAAMCLLVLWQDARRSSNQLTALALACFSLYSATNLVFHFSYPFNVSPLLTLNLTATAYGWSMFTLFAAATRLARLHLPIRIAFMLVGLAFAILLTLVIGTDAAFQNVTLLPDHATQYDFTLLGLITFVALLLYELIGVGLVWQVKNDRSRSLWPFLIMMPFAAVLNALPSLQAWPHDALSLLVVGAIMARLIMHEHVYKPMEALHRQLMQTNTELEHANLIKSQFLANMSHELRTPLNSVIGYTDLIVSGLYGPLNEKQEDRLNKIARNGRLLLALINDVLDLSKIEAGRLTLVREQIALPLLVEPVLKELRPLAESKGLTIRCDYPPDLPLLLVDTHRAEQILRNVINNAIRFTTQGGIAITAEREADEVIIRVSDTGHGIAPARHSQIFSSTAITLAAGTPPEARQVGLTLTRHLVQLHGGRIWFTSEGIAGKGTTFYITFPLALDIASFSSHSAQSRGTILCIDDSTETLEVLQGMLESASYQVDTALDDRAAWQRIRERTPDVILLDILIPGIDGWQILKKLRMDPKTALVPVIVISGLDQRSRAQQAGALNSLSKPLRRAELLDNVRLAQQRSASGSLATTP